VSNASLLARAEAPQADGQSAEVREVHVSISRSRSPKAVCLTPTPWHAQLCRGGGLGEPSGRNCYARLPGEAGLTVVELAFSLAIICVIVVVVFEAYANAYPALRASSAVQLLQAQLRQAREVSIDQRRSVQVTFQGTAEMVAVIQGINGAANTTLYDYFLPEKLSYVLESGVPDTPDAFGNSYAVNYACPSNTLPCTITFQSDGSVLDGSNGSTNGTIFIGIASQTQTARAVTILSATGRIKAWSYNGSAWH